MDNLQQILQYLSPAALFFCWIPSLISRISIVLWLFKTGILEVCCNNWLKHNKFVIYLFTCVLFTSIIVKYRVTTSRTLKTMVMAFFHSNSQKYMACRQILKQIRSRKIKNKLLSNFWPHQPLLNLTLQYILCYHRNRNTSSITYHFNRIELAYSLTSDLHKR